MPLVSCHFVRLSSNTCNLESESEGERICSTCPREMTEGSVGRSASTLRMTGVPSLTTATAEFDVPKSMPIIAPLAAQACKPFGPLAFDLRTTLQFTL